MLDKPVNVKSRLNIINERGKKALIYHQINVTQPYSTLNLQFKVDNVTSTRLVVLGRHNKLPTLKDCEFVQFIANIKREDVNADSK